MLQKDRERLFYFFLNFYLLNGMCIYIEDARDILHTNTGGQKQAA